MALTFDGGDDVNHGSGASLDALSTWSALAWICSTTISGTRCILHKGTDATPLERAFTTAAVGVELRVRVVRATTNTVYISNNAALTANVWRFVAATFDSGAGAGEIVNLYAGSLTALASERTYGTATDGSGAVTSEAAYDLRVGNNDAGDGFIGRIAWLGHWNRVLTLGEILAQQFRPHKTSGCVLFSHYGYNGTTSVPDWSGSGNAGTVTGAVVGAHVPLGPPFGWGPYPPTYTRWVGKPPFHRATRVWKRKVG